MVWREAAALKKSHIALSHDDCRLTCKLLSSCSSSVLACHREIQIARTIHTVSASCYKLTAFGRFCLIGCEFVNRSAFLDLVEHSNVIESDARSAQESINLCFEELAPIALDQINLVSVAERVACESNGRIVLFATAGQIDIILHYRDILGFEVT